MHQVVDGQAVNVARTVRRGEDESANLRRMCVEVRGNLVENRVTETEFGQCRAELRNVPVSQWLNQCRPGCPLAPAAVHICLETCTVYVVQSVVVVPQCRLRMPALEET